jgi:hypothetical protein
MMLVLFHRSRPDIAESPQRGRRDAGWPPPARTPVFQALKADLHCRRSTIRHLRARWMDITGMPNEEENREESATAEAQPCG